jgi:preprotein translocase subunit SecB
LSEEKSPNRPGEQPRAELKGPGIRVSQIFLEKAVFSHRGDVLTMPAGGRANLGRAAFTVQVGVTKDKKNGFARLGVKTETEGETDSEARPQYDIDVVVTGLISQTDPAGLPIEEFLRSGGAISLLYPFLREALTNLTIRGRFGPIYLDLVNVQELAAGLRQAISAEEASKTDPEGRGA